MKHFFGLSFFLITFFKSIPFKIHPDVSKINTQKILVFKISTSGVFHMSSGGVYMLASNQRLLLISTLDHYT